VTGPLRLGIVGCGRVTMWCHIPALEATEAVEVVSVADLDEQRRARAASRLGIDAAYGSAAELLAGTPVDAVGICVPATGHADLVEEVLAAGRHVLVEKPLAQTLEDCDRIIGTAAGGLTVAVGLNYRCHRLIREARDVLASGVLGRLVLIETSLTNAVLRSPELPDWVHAVGSTPMLEKGVHQFDFWRLLGGSEVTSVVALATGEGNADDSTAGVLARLANGTVCVTSLSSLTGSGHLVSLCGEERRLDLRLDPPRTPEFGTAGKPEPAAHESAAEASSWGQWSSAMVLTAEATDRIASYTAEWEDFAAAIHDGRPSAATPEDGRAAVTIAHAAIRSLVERLPVALPP
jgi:predicted dehydrogenase